LIDFPLLPHSPILFTRNIWERNTHSSIGLVRQIHDYGFHARGLRSGLLSCASPLSNNLIQVSKVIAAKGAETKSSCYFPNLHKMPKCGEKRGLA